MLVLLELMSIEPGELRASPSISMAHSDMTVVTVIAGLCDSIVSACAVPCPREFPVLRACF